MPTEDEVTFYRETDAPADALEGESVAVVGYGNLGRSMALNLRDAGLRVRVGNIDDDYRRRADADGFGVEDVGAAVAGADVAYLLIPDEVMADCYQTAIEPRLRPGQALCFASGYALAYGLVTAPGDVDVLLLAPRMLGEEVRRTYEEGVGFFSYLSVEQDATGRAWARLLGLAAGSGSLRRGAMRLSAREEALLDLFIEQTVGPYLGTAIQLGFQVGTEAGLPPEALVLEMYMSGELARTLQTFAEVGFFKSASWHGEVAQYGGFLGTLAIDREGMERMFRETLETIRSGKFADKFQAEQRNGYPTVEAIRAITGGGDPITNAEERVRDALG